MGRIAFAYIRPKDFVSLLDGNHPIGAERPMLRRMKFH
jgi:hypothetical protein